MEITPFTVDVLRGRGRATCRPVWRTPAGRPTSSPTGAAACRPSYARNARRDVGDPVRLAGPGGPAQRVPAVHGHDRRPDDPLRPRPLEGGGRDAAPARPRLSELVRRVHPDDRPARGPGGARRPRRGRLPRRGPVAARVRVLRRRRCPAGASSARPAAFDQIMQALGYERYGVSRRRRRRGDLGGAVPAGRRPDDRVAGRHGSGRDRDRVHARRPTT